MIEMKTNTQIWMNLKKEPMSNANPADLADHTIPSNTGFLYQLGGGQTWGLYFPNGGEVLAGGLYTASKKQPIEVWDDAVSGKSTKAGRGSSQLEEKTFGIPGFIVSDVSAKGLQFSLTGAAGKTTGQTTHHHPISLGGMGAAASLGPSTTVKAVKPEDYAKQKGLIDADEPSDAKPGRNTSAAKIVAIGNWDVVPKFLAD